MAGQESLYVRGAWLACPMLGWLAWQSWLKVGYLVRISLSWMVSSKR